MTVIAYRDGVMASDSAISDNVTVYAPARKIARGPDGALYGWCGHTAIGSEFLRWVDAGASGEHPPLKVGEPYVDVIVALPDGTVQVWTSEGREDYGRAAYMAAGTGAPVALGALHAGADAVGAVEAGLAHGLRCGGAVQVVRR